MLFIAHIYNFSKMNAKKIVFISLGVVIASSSIYLFWLPYVPQLKKNNPALTSLMIRREHQAQKAGKKMKSEMYWRRIDEISPHLVHAVLLAEDDTFYHHHGFDFEQIKIAVKINWKKKKFAYGGSTITQQLARTLYLSPSKNLLRKLKEAFITAWLEQSLSKRRILEVYLNVIEWGSGIYGAEAAARHYYGKSCSDLTPAESVALASILPSPRKWSPYKETPFMMRRRTDILRRMQVEGYIPSEAEKEENQLQLSTELGDDEGNEEKNGAGANEGSTRSAEKPTEAIVEKGKE